MARNAGISRQTRLMFQTGAYSLMTIRVELNPETEARLKAEARAKGLPLEKVAEQLLKEALTGRPLSRGQMSVEEFHRMLDAMAEGSERLPDLPTESFSREAFYL